MFVLPKIYYVVITKFKDSSMLNKNNSYNYTYCIVPCQVIPTNITLNTVQFQIRKTNTFSFTVFDKLQESLFTWGFT